LAEVISAKISQHAVATNKLCKHGSSVIDDKRNITVIKILIVVHGLLTTKKYRHYKVIQYVPIL